MVARARESALIVEVPEAEHAVGRHRQALDVHARLGVPAHITVLYPFMPAGAIGSSVLEQLRRIFRSTATFPFRLTSTAWFGDDVLWLAPADPQPFRAVTALVFAAFPDYPPSAGQYADVVPHLTVAHGCSLADMQAAEQAVRQDLPIHGWVRSVSLMVQPDSSGIWSRHTRFSLADTQGT